MAALMNRKASLSDVKIEQLIAAKDAQNTQNVIKKATVVHSLNVVRRVVTATSSVGKLTWEKQHTVDSVHERYMGKFLFHFQ